MHYISQKINLKLKIDYTFIIYLFFYFEVYITHEQLIIIDIHIKVHRVITVESFV